MSTLVEWLHRACEALDLDIEEGFLLTLTDGSTVTCLARLPQLGAPNGMLVVASFDPIRPYLEEVHLAGYDFSVLDEPRIDEHFDLPSFREMITDWGWSDASLAKPAWMNRTNAASDAYDA